MYKASNDTSKNYDIFVEIIEQFGLSGEQVLDILTDWHGLQLMTKDFMENLFDEMDI